MSELFRFIWAVINNWAGYATGGLLVALVWAWSVWKDKPAPRTALLVLAGLFLFLAFFKAWDDQRIIADEMRQENAELSESRFDLGVLSAFVGDDAPASSHVVLVATLKNLGAPSAVDALTWTFDATSAAGRTVSGAPRTLKAGNNDVPLDAKSFRRFVPEDALDVKASRVIDRNGYAQGVLFFAFEGIDKAGLMDSQWRIGGKDVRGRVFFAETDARTLQATAGKRTVLTPGLTYPVALTRDSE